MSCSVKSIPPKAVTLAEIEGIIPPAASPVHAGKSMRVRLLEARIGDTLTRWVTVRIEGVASGNYGRPTYAKSFTGRNLKYAQEFYDVNAAELAR